MKALIIASVALLSFTTTSNYSWKKEFTTHDTIEQRIVPPKGYTRVKLESTSFGYWLRNLPLKPKGTPVKLYDGTEKYSQNLHEAVVDLNFIGKDLQQCIDAVLRLRAEYLWDTNQKDKIAFSYTCCKEKIPWSKWSAGWRTKILKRNGRWTFDWVKSAAKDESRKNFEKYLYNVMTYAGTQSLSRDMQKISTSDVQPGDAYVQGGAPGYGHGIIILDMVENAAGKKKVLLGQSYTPAENFNILKNPNASSPWYDVDFGETLDCPQWTFNKTHGRRFSE